MKNAAKTGNESDSVTAKQTNATEYPLWEDPNRTLEALADAAPTLKEAELRVLLELIRRRDRATNTVKASSRELANACKLTRPKVQAALDSLAARSLITTRQGTATTSSAHQINILRTVQIGGSFREPPPVQPGLFQEPPPAPLGSHPGSFSEPPPTENTGLPESADALKIDPVDLRVIYRVLSAKPADHDPQVVAQFRRWMHGFMCKLGHTDQGQPNPNAHPPQDGLVAQFLSIAEPRRLATMLDSLLLDRQHHPTSYAWFISVGLQRIHGISWQKTRAARAALRVVHPEGRTEDREFSQRLLEQASQSVGAMKR